jgi:hypothetical protein
MEYSKDNKPSGITESDLDVVIENKLRENLKWSMLFFVFNIVCKMSSGKQSNNNVHKDFFKQWKRFIVKNLVKQDLEAINTILNSPENTLYAEFFPNHKAIESTELYQEKYNNIIKNIEIFFNKNLSDIQDKND